jgi:REP-associated tyrosine transposase
MARIARVVVPDLPHHVTQRGNRRERVFFEDGDYGYYLHLVSTAARRADTAIWAYCLMPNHVHFIMTPSSPDGLRATFAEAHRRYTSVVNSRRGQTGHLWQGRFASTVMDERHLLAAARYIAMNPVRAGLAPRAADWRWSSVGAHLAGRDDRAVQVAPLLERVGDFAEFLDEPSDEAAVLALRASSSTGRPAGAPDWVARLEAQAGRRLTPGRRGPKPRPRAEPDQPRLSGDGYYGDSLLNSDPASATSGPHPS